MRSDFLCLILSSSFCLSTLQLPSLILSSLFHPEAETSHSHFQRRTGRSEANWRWRWSVQAKHFFRAFHQTPTMHPIASHISHAWTQALCPWTHHQGWPWLWEYQDGSAGLGSTLPKELLNERKDSLRLPGCKFSFKRKAELATQTRDNFTMSLVPLVILWVGKKKKNYIVISHGGKHQNSSSGLLGPSSKSLNFFKP